tara:strand:- start:144 stop:959 length:816 start_codon:yes stop_codon:yes gene_type:complete
MNYILIDTSYLIFYRYYAIIQWWKHAKKDEEVPYNPYENTEFVDKFTKTFLASVSTIKKKLKIHKEECCVIAGSDCPRRDIWRNNFYGKYKEQRYKDDVFMGGLFFKHVYSNNFLEQTGVKHILKFPKLEGDDVIAITKNFIRAKYPDSKIYIITNDHDYLQLLDENCKIFNLQFKNLSENKKAFTDPYKNLFYKIVLGDKSDNIEPVFKKCGLKTVEKYYEDPELFQQAIEKESVQEKFDLNKKLISFSEIPEELVQSFIKKYQDIFNDL